MNFEEQNEKKEKRIIKNKKKTHPSFILIISPIPVHPFPHSASQGGIPNFDDRLNELQSCILEHGGATNEGMFCHFDGSVLGSFGGRSGGDLDVLQESHCTTKNLGSKIFVLLLEFNPLIVEE